MKKLVIATRGSALALWQANHIRDRILVLAPELEVTLSVIKTRGDIILDVPLSQVGGKGLFVKEIEEALLSGAADLAVHSMKDVPMFLPEGLLLAAVPERANPTDVLLSAAYADLESLPKGGRIGTCSLRRKAQILRLRPDLTVQDLRGNVDTRRKKLMDGQFDAIIMAAAGMTRLGLSVPHAFPLTPPDFLPAVGQGALGIECREDAADLRALLNKLDHSVTNLCVRTERAFSRALNGGCQAPIAGYATFGDDYILRLTGLVASLDGTTEIRGELAGAPEEAEALGMALAQDLLERGAEALLP